MFKYSKKSGTYNFNLSKLQRRMLNTNSTTQVYNEDIDFEQSEEDELWDWNINYLDLSLKEYFANEVESIVSIFYFLKHFISLVLHQYSSNEELKY